MKMKYKERKMKGMEGRKRKKLEKELKDKNGRKMK
jgi:hypothetical protein